MAYRRDEMWSRGRYDYQRFPRGRVPPRNHPSDAYHRVVNIVPKQTPLLEERPPPLLEERPPPLLEERPPPLLEERPPPLLEQRPPPLLEQRPRLLEQRPPLLEMRPPPLDRPAEGSYSRCYSHVRYREYDEGRSFSHDRRSGPPHRGDESGYRWPRGDHSARRQPEYRGMRESFRGRSFYSSHYSRERPPRKRDAPFFRESPVGRKDSPHGRSASRGSRRSYFPERRKPYSFHPSQHRRKERPVQSLETGRDTSPSTSSAVPSAAVLDKPRRPTEREPDEAARKWAAERLKSGESNLPEMSEFETGSAAPLFTEQPEEPESNPTDSTELGEDSQRNRRAKAIESKLKEVEQVYRQDCETFGMVVQMLVEKDPSLEESIQLALRQNLHDMGERCVEELKRFIAEYDTST